eukprot:g6646.t1
MRDVRRAATPSLRLVSVLLQLLTSLELGSCALTELEEEYVAVPLASGARESLKYITSKPHVAGSPGDHEMARYVHDRFASLGVPRVEIQPVDALLSNPIESSLQLLDASTGSVVFTASLSEDVLEIDTTSDTWYRNHTFNGYSPSGDVTAPLVYANFGRPEDFDALEEAGVSVEGTIVIARYGQCFRGLKAMNAQDRGAVGTIIYSDPDQDGSSRGPTYPDGGWRPSSSVQRGSVQFNSRCAGDPSRTANPRSVKDVCGFEKDELVPVTPVMPISYGDAEPLLRALGGAAAPEGFQGGLNFTYTVGPSRDTTVKMVVKNEEHVGPLWNVIGTIPGTLPARLDQPIVLGNHRDAWVFGAVDPNSGTACLIEVARGLGALLKGGWKPMRTIILCSWSGEELGMLGSTAWGEENAEGILKKAAAYLNVDSAVSGHLLRVLATPSLGGLVKGALADVEDPDSGLSLLEAWSGELGTLGSGSDYVVFLDHLGIATVDVAFQQDPVVDYGVYHSVYDSFSWVDNYGDPGFLYFQTMSKVWGLMALRLSSSHVLPFDPPLQADALEGYVAALYPPSAGSGGTEDVDIDVEERGDAARASAAVVAKSAVSLSEIDLAPLEEAVAAFRTAADKIGFWSGRRDSGGGGGGGGRISTTTGVAAARAAALRGAGAGLLQEEEEEEGGRGGGARGDGAGGGAGGGALPTGGRLSSSAVDRLQKESLNQRLAMTERRFLADEGLPGRPWFRHVLQAPGLYLGYAAESFPGITQALSDGDLSLAQEQVLVAAACVSDAAAFLSGEEAGEA